MPVRAIIADDERLMRDSCACGWARLGPSCKSLAKQKWRRGGSDWPTSVRTWRSYDIQMPGRTGIEAARDIGAACHVVFVTAFSEFAIEAFEQGAVDYILKPAETERLVRTVARLKERVGAAPRDLEGLLRQISTRLGRRRGAARHLQWIQASMGQQLRLIPVAEVLFFTSDEKYTRVQTEGFEALIRKPIKELVEELDPEQFWQIHRATIVNIKKVAGVVRDFRGRQLVQFTNCQEKQEISRNYTHLFKQM